MTMPVPSVPVEQLPDGQAIATPTEPVEGGPGIPVPDIDGPVVDATTGQPIPAESGLFTFTGDFTTVNPADWQEVEQTPDGHPVYRHLTDSPVDALWEPYGATPAA